MRKPRSTMEPINVLRHQRSGLCGKLPRQLSESLVPCIGLGPLADRLSVEIPSPHFPRVGLKRAVGGKLHGMVDL